MSTLKLDTTGDLAIESNELVILSDLVAETAQRLTIKFKFFLGEWLLDDRVGLPLYEKVLVKNPNLSEIRRIYRSVILNDPAVDTLENFDLELNTSTRTLSLDFQAVLNDGSNLVFEDFILAEYQ